MASTHRICSQIPLQQPIAKFTSIHHDQNHKSNLWPHFNNKQPFLFAKQKQTRAKNTTEKEEIENCPAQSSLCSQKPRPPMPLSSSAAELACVGIPVPLP
ncbi:hypothetical protein M0R45_031066 [Rubus argutus]|uniref:Uncharacterized protein n=1 Tax=Rubus argutus TaxID=59490 RepID=A0AAW1WFD0_RUBAR